MDRRRSTRPASSEEVDCWTHATLSLTELATKYATAETTETITRTNRLISVWPLDDTLPAQGIDNVKSTYKKLVPNLNEIKNTADLEAKALDEAIERLGVLIALRNAPESLSQEKRYKRPRAHSPPSHSPAPTGPRAGGISLTIPARPSAAPSPAVQSKVKTSGIARHLPLQQGRRVAFRPPPKDNEETNWILAIVSRCISPEKHKYEVVDAEPQESPPQLYPTTVRALIPLPDPNAPINSPAHPSTYPVFEAGSAVMALYPDTTCFYRAEVLEPPGRSRSTPSYKLRFDDDDNLEHAVPVHMVVDWPGH